MLKCRPDTPGQTFGNRPPTNAEMHSCRPCLFEQIDIIQPKAIVALGATAMKGLLDLDAPMRDLRGRWHDYKGIPVMATYHPSYLLRNQLPSGEAQSLGRPPAGQGTAGPHDHRTGPRLLREQRLDFSAALPCPHLPHPCRSRPGVSPPGIAPIDGGVRGGRESGRIAATAHGHPAGPHGSRRTARCRRAAGLTRHRCANREAAVMAEQRRLRRQLEASLRDQLLTGTASTEDTIVCQLCELLWADHACLWMLPSLPDEAHDWSRQTIVSEAVAEYYPLVGYSTCTPTEEWSRDLPGAVAASRRRGAVFRPRRSTTPKEGDPTRPPTRAT